MEYKPQKEKEIRDAMLLEPGTYDFEIATASEKTSKAGNDMIEMQVRVFPNDGGNPRMLKDWLVGGSGLGELKINRFCHATGLQDSYFDGSFSALTCVGVSGKCKVTVGATEKYGDQNNVRDYLPVSEAQDLPAAPAKKAKPAEAEKPTPPANEYEAQLAATGDDIPF